jgi:hypothetical protein
MYNVRRDNDTITTGCFVAFLGDFFRARFLVWAHFRKWAQKPVVGPNRKWVSTRSGPKPEVVPNQKLNSKPEVGIKSEFMLIF